ncbi:excalibur calcium-binding domain-containing protein [Saccharopolyspora sp. WRP15-2]|uniref:Excalibur calcium-binding domain-containing protein n=2 Tax=Saccharopolyspora oryzae TaxID=2997343 RepID=A0ABT4US18_9PSEU|nr:excalibur calcium-binding domain-containing protein [Saccharopolyspora oryzae]MDA3624503.1 excalibur calcium-binding domain-containing protein [Saccharopolyspora oryzae]
MPSLVGTSTSQAQQALAALPGEFTSEVVAAYADDVTGIAGTLVCGTNFPAGASISPPATITLYVSPNAVACPTGLDYPSLSANLNLRPTLPDRDGDGDPDHVDPAPDDSQRTLAQPDGPPKPPPPPPPPAPTPEEKSGGGDSSSTYYPNCTAARKAGAAPLYAGEPGYRSGLDRDHDGVACE